MSRGQTLIETLLEKFNKKKPEGEGEEKEGKVIEWRELRERVVEWREWRENVVE